MPEHQVRSRTGEEQRLDIAIALVGSPAFAQVFGDYQDVVVKRHLRGQGGADELIGQLGVFVGSLARSIHQEVTRGE